MSQRVPIAMSSTKMLSRSENFPSPWMDVASASMPTQIKDILQWAEYIYQASDVYRSALERINAYFLTSVEIKAAQSDKKLGDDEKAKYATFLKDTLGILDVIASLDRDGACYGNAFATMLVPFRRHLSCKKCGTQFPLRVIGETASFKFKFTSKHEFKATCPACKYVGPWNVVDVPGNLEADLKVKMWNPHEIEILHDIYSGDTAYLWRIPEEYKRQIRSGNIFALERCPKNVLRAIANNALFRFYPGVMFHMKEPTLGGLKNRGWGLPKAMANFRPIWYLQVLRRYNEAIALDYIIPFRLLTPEARSGSGVGGGQAVDPLLSMNMGDFSGQVRGMLKQRRQDPARWNVLPFPVSYQALGGDAKQLAPSELLDQGQDMVLNSINTPSELYRNNMSMQTAPVALRLFEATQHSVVHANDTFLYWLGTQISQLLSWESVELAMRQVSHADDFQKQMALLQLMMGGMISRTTGLQMMGVDFKNELRTLGEESRDEQVIRAEIQEEMEQSAFGEQVSKGMGQPPQGDPAAGGAPQSGGVPAAGGGAQGPVSAMLADGGTPTTPNDMLAQAESIAQQLLTLPESQKDSELRMLKQKNEPMHALVKSKLETIRNQASTAGKSMILGQ